MAVHALRVALTACHVVPLAIETFNPFVSYGIAPTFSGLHGSPQGYFRGRMVDAMWAEPTHSSLPTMPSPTLFLSLLAKIIFYRMSSTMTISLLHDKDLAQRYLSL